jgi:hypothetical protein
MIVCNLKVDIVVPDGGSCRICQVFLLLISRLFANVSIVQLVRVRLMIQLCGTPELMMICWFLFVDNMIVLGNALEKLD